MCCLILYILDKEDMYKSKNAELDPQRRPGETVLVRVIICLVQALTLGAVQVLGAEI